jgi:hypothetical protein
MIGYTGSAYVILTTKDGRRSYKSVKFNEDIFPGLNSQVNLVAHAILATTEAPNYEEAVRRSDAEDGKMQWSRNQFSKRKGYVDAC